MTEEQISQWVREAGLGDSHGHLVKYYADGIQAFAQLVHNATLEEAAVVCEEMADRARTLTGAARSDACADKIRSMK
jgi:hypothetical protein